MINSSFQICQQTEPPHTLLFPPCVSFSHSAADTTHCEFCTFFLRSSIHHSPTVDRPTDRPTDRPFVRPSTAPVVTTTTARARLARSLARSLYADTPPLFRTLALLPRLALALARSLARFRSRSSVFSPISLPLPPSTITISGNEKEEKEREGEMEKERVRRHTRVCMYSALLYFITRRTYISENTHIHTRTLSLTFSLTIQLVPHLYEILCATPSLSSSLSRRSFSSYL